MKPGMRIFLMAALAAAIWALSLPTTPSPLPEDASPSRFSAARTREVLTRLLGPQAPHPAGSSANNEVRARLMTELARLDIPARTLSGMSCAARRTAVACAEISDVVAEAIPGPKETNHKSKAILLMAHLDSVAAGPGAGDDASGVAILLETLRALKADPAGQGHPVIALFTDGEETGLLGASYFLKQPQMRGRIGVVVNAEARGTDGPSYLFQTSRNDRGLIALYAKAAIRPAASSLYGEIYKYLPNDTDLTPFLEAGLPGYNFAFIGESARYHTPRDTLENLSPGSLQSQGDNVLSLTRALRTANFASFQSGSSIYFDWLGMLPRLPRGLALPLALLALLAIAFAAWAGRREKAPRAAFLTPVLLLALAVGMGFALHWLAARISGNPDPSFAHPVYLRVALIFGVWTALLVAARFGGGLWAWAWLAGLGVMAAIFAPGLSPYFIFPASAAGVLLLLTMRGQRRLALLLAALVGMSVWIGLAARTEPIMGLSAHFLFTVPAALGLMTLLPLLGNGVFPLPEIGKANFAPPARGGGILVSLLLAIGFAMAAGLQPPFSDERPQRLNLRYVEKDGKSWLLADPVARLPAEMRASFSAAPGPLVAWRGYVREMGNSRLPSPSASVMREGQRLTLDLHGGKQASGMILALPAGLSRLSINGAAIPVAGQTMMRCATPGCTSARLVMDLKGRVPKGLLLAEEHRGLLPRAREIAKARPAWSVPSGQGDMTYVATDVNLP